MKENKIYIVVSDQKPDGKHVEELPEDGFGVKVPGYLERAIAAAKPSALEGWREGLHLPWYRSSDRVIDSRGFSIFSEVSKCGANSAQKQLIAAAPDTAEALIELLRVYSASMHSMNCWAQARAALRKVLPDDVAKEVLDG